ncbi:MAG: hypothetical protein Kow0099_33500 [Candidatus Abyssubacteria bacterium]
MECSPTSSCGSERWRRAFFAITILAFVAASVSYSVVIPVFESQDEVNHFQFIKYLANEARLPDYHDFDELASAGAEAIQTPLYYAFQALLLRLSGNHHIDFEFAPNPFRCDGIAAIHYHNQPGEEFPYSGKFRMLHLLRLTNVAAGVLVLFVVYKSLLHIPFLTEDVRLAAVAFVALIPQFTYLCGTLNNDAFSILFASLTLLFLMRFMHDPGASTKYVALVAVSVGAAILSKQMTLSFLPACYLATLYRGPARRRIVNTLVLTGVLAVVIGWYYARNWLLFDDPFSTKTLELVAPNLVQRKSPSQLGVYLFDHFVPSFITSFWGSFGYMTVWLHWNLYLLYNLIAGFGLLAFAAGWLDPAFRQRFSHSEKAVLALFGVVVLFLLAEILAYNLSFSQPQGRYAFNALVCLAIFWGLGIDRTLSGGQTRLRALCLGLILSFASLNFLIICTTVTRAYPRLPRTLDVVQNRVQVNFGPLLKNTMVGQTFRCGIDGLDQIAVMFTTYKRYNNSHIVFRLKDLSEPAEDLFTQKIPAADLRNNTYHIFRFPQQRDSRGRNYLFLLEFPDATESQAVSCFYTVSDTFAGGTAILNNKALPGDLTFITGRT